jgi:hypothetical protein
MIQITMTATTTRTQLGISVPAIDVFRLNHSMIALPRRPAFLLTVLADSLVRINAGVAGTTADCLSWSYPTPALADREEPSRATFWHVFSGKSAIG